MGLVEDAYRREGKLLQENERLKAALERLRSCSHACVPPCPHTRRFEEVTRAVLPPRRVTPYPAETGRGGSSG